MFRRRISVEPKLLERVWEFLLDPHNEYLWTAVGTLAGLVGAYYAARAVWLVFRDKPPVVHLVRQDHGTALANLGQAVALTVVVMNDKKEIIANKSAIPSSATVSVSSSMVNDSDTYYMYARTDGGRWFRTTANYGGLTWSDRSDFNNTFPKHIWPWRLPLAVRLELKRSGESSLQHIRAVLSFFTIRGWDRRLRRAGIWWGIRIPRWTEAPLEVLRLRCHGSRGDLASDADVDPGIRAGWAVDVTGFNECWQGPRSIRQRSCVREGGAIVCEMSVSMVVAQSRVRGLLRITDAAWRRLPTDSDARKAVVVRKFYAYVCRLRPKNRFVCNLCAFGPWVVNRP